MEKIKLSVLKKLSDVLHLSTMYVNFTYQKLSFDKDMTKLGFLNKVKGEFNDQVEKFNEQLEQEIKEASSSK